MIFRTFTPCMVATALALSGCNYTEGQCYPRGEGGGAIAAGVGGSLFPGGAGGFGDVPPAPQETSGPMPPDCNVVPATPCHQKCLTDYEAAASKCTPAQGEDQQKACRDAAYAEYKGCKDMCQQTANPSCDDKYQDCVNNGPAKCLKKSAGKTVCYRCWERCNAGDSPSGECSDCRF